LVYQQVGPIPSRLHAITRPSDQVA
jgi:hypothetical protein